MSTLTSPKKKLKKGEKTIIKTLKKKEGSRKRREGFTREMCCDAEMVSSIEGDRRIKERRKGKGATAEDQKRGGVKLQRGTIVALPEDSSGLRRLCTERKIVQKKEPGLNLAKVSEERGQGSERYWSELTAVGVGTLHSGNGERKAASLRVN